MLPPDAFLRWWFSRAQEDGLESDYRILLPRYFGCSEEIRYIWQHYNDRYKSLESTGLRGRRVLDVGCGIGTEVLWAALHGARTVGLELHRWSLSVARKRLAVLEAMGLPVGQCEIRHQGLMDLEESNSFDVIFLRETFHHLEPRLLVVEKLARLLKPGGWLIIEDTNGWNPFIQIKYLLARGFRTVVLKEDSETGTKYLFGNERITTPRNIARLFNPYGITGEVRYFRLLPTKIAVLPFVASVVGLLEPSIGKLPFFWPICLHYTWVGRKS